MSDPTRLALIAIMNALDVHMPPDGAQLLKELREIAATVGYPWSAQAGPGVVQVVQALRKLPRYWMHIPNAAASSAQVVCWVDVQRMLEDDDVQADLDAFAIWRAQGKGGFVTGHDIVDGICGDPRYAGLSNANSRYWKIR